MLFCAFQRLQLTCTKLCYKLGAGEFSEACGLSKMALDAYWGQVYGGKLLLLVLLLLVVACWCSPQHGRSPNHSSSPHTASLGFCNLKEARMKSLADVLACLGFPHPCCTPNPEIPGLSRQDACVDLPKTRSGLF